MSYRFLLLLIPFFSQAQTAVEKGRKLWEAKNPKEAREILLKIDDESGDYAEAQFYLGRISYDAKKFDDAKDYFEEATEANPKVAEYFNFLGNTYGLIAQDGNIITQGMYVPKMRDAWQETIRLDPKHIEAHWSLLQFYTRAPGFIGGSFDKAKEMATTIGKLNPSEGHRAMGTVYLREKNHAEAEKEFIAMAKDPAYTAALANYYVGQKQYDKAYAVFENQLAKKTDDYGMLYQLGRISVLSGTKLDEGEAALRKYLTHTPKPHEPSHAWAHMRIAQILEKKGNKPEAKKTYELALKADPTLQEAKDGLKRVHGR